VEDSKAVRLESDTGSRLREGFLGVGYGVCEVNPVLILSYNGLPLLKKCVESVRKQDVPTHIYVFDNASQDGTRPWLETQVGMDFGWNGSNENLGVSRGWNCGLSYLFLHLDYDHVLVLNQDLQLGPSAYRELLEFNVPFVTGFPVDTPFEISPIAGKPQIGLTPYPCFSAFLIRRDCWKKVGPFKEEQFDDEGNRKMVGFWSWANDCSYHVEAHRLGIDLWKSGVPFYHEASSTLRNASPEEREFLRKMGDEDREVFKSLYGCKPGEPEYSKLFDPVQILES
jgi:cellulose synthase/poly-beta-1,6-N-acetylglucosamine synthase-like glycosyltransferase